MSEQEFVEVTVKLPKNVVDFLRDIARLTDLDVEEYVRDLVTRGIISDLDMVSETAFWTPERLKAKYRLEHDP